MWSARRLRVCLQTQDEGTLFSPDRLPNEVMTVKANLRGGSQPVCVAADNWTEPIASFEFGDVRARSYLRDSDAGWVVTASGVAWFGGVGIDVKSLRAGRRRLVRTCLDWSERRYHLAGALGSALAERSFARGWLARVRQSRAVRLTDRGRAALREELGIAL